MGLGFKVQGLDSRNVSYKELRENVLPFRGCTFVRMLFCGGLSWGPNLPKIAANHILASWY